MLVYPDGLRRALLHMKLALRRAYREVSASFAPRATNDAAKVRRIHVITRGRSSTWRRTAEPNSP